MKEKGDTTCGGLSDAGSHWARTTYSAPWSVITSAPRSVPLMLKLATLPRSRRERDWWRATPGRSGKAPRCHYPQKAPPSAPGHACRDVFRMQRFWNAAFQMPRVWNAAASLGSVTRDDPSVHARRPKPLAQDDPSRSSTTALGAAAARNAPRARTQLAKEVFLFFREA